MAIKNHLLAEACKHYVILFFIYFFKLQVHMRILASSLNTVIVVVGCTGIVSRTLKQAKHNCIPTKIALFIPCIET